ncbi:hypothetical protein [Crocosphaera sp.]|uniref:hypothetical protein n=1 Tax=Crocosphaera sp. TaxID=2729996 RepID=UPI00261B28F9|nr:hypothetical protein [Crocosphaera sp.]MDJ0579834.1 hypothetical protein [Crocosphaera sp.]
MEIEEQWIADAVKSLIKRGEETTALFLMDCSLNLKDHDICFEFNGDNTFELVSVYIECSLHQYEVLENDSHDITLKVKQAISTTKPYEIAIRNDGNGIYPLLKKEQHPENWREQYKESILGQKIHNQGLPEDKTGKYKRYQWNNFELGSLAELAIARELDTRDLVFFPNSKARTKINKSSYIIIPDFLVCCKGKWGILQCDHESTHPYAAEDHKKDRYFRIHGVKVIERYDYEDCVKNAKNVVDQFLNLLDKNG